jgi:hypothetical protein
VDGWGGVRGARPRGGENGAERGGQGSATWTSTTWTRRLRAAPIAAGGARLASAAATEEDGGARVADRRDRATSGPVGSGWVREGVRGSGGGGR